jgi:L-threonylcarbamoyladenylate synthase
MTEDIQKAGEVLRAGGVILYPTDTVWGLGCDATNSEAVKKIYAIKKRSDSKSMLVLADAPVRIERFADDIPDVAWDLMDLATSPLTIIYPKGKNLAPELLAEDGSIGIRLCKDEFCQKLIARLGKPIVSTSANISGEPSPALFDEISQDIINAVDYVVRYRQDDLHRAKPSSIIKLGKTGEIKIIRE